MKKLELLKTIVEAKKNEVTEPVVYTGRFEEGQWMATSLKDRYQDFVKTVEVIDDEEPEAAIDDFIFVGGGGGRLSREVGGPSGHPVYCTSSFSLHTIR